MPASQDSSILGCVSTIELRPMAKMRASWDASISGCRHLKMRVSQDAPRCQRCQHLKMPASQDAPISGCRHLKMPPSWDAPGASWDAGILRWSWGISRWAKPACAPLCTVPAAKRKHAYNPCFTAPAVCSACDACGEERSVRNPRFTVPAVPAIQIARKSNLRRKLDPVWFRQDKVPGTWTNIWN